VAYVLSAAAYPYYGQPHERSRNVFGRPASSYYTPEQVLPVSNNKTTTEDEMKRPQRQQQQQRQQQRQQQQQQQAK